MTRMDRRRFLSLSGLALSGAVVGTAIPAVAHADADSATWRQKTSLNGWPVLSEGETQRFRIEGSGLSVRLAPAAAPVLLYVARRFIYEIDSQLQAGEITGYTDDRNIAASYESAYLSGSGITIRPLLYPMGAENGFFEHEKIVIRDILADCDGVIAWGGDLDPVKESHFHITVPATSSEYRNLVDRLRTWEDSPGKGAGAIDAFIPERLQRAGSN
ncbi:hypothetical protein [Saccharomonospora viridis]|uniref:hypothetical protein n=1 Tax=Saccharomonospora viridis TaxID=1852 RepID=UPI00117BEBE3|nr:hypothetical protein [Saccharomonospora viridis]